ncbi:piwi domain protein [Trichuris suis]|nr:piwi domain protein [Trichuris suis]
MTSTSGELSSSVSGLTISDLIGRPDYGTEGKKIQLVSNFVELKKVAKGLIEVIQYRVDMATDKVKLTRDDKRDIFWKFVKENPKVFTKPFGMAYDGEALLFSREPLAIKEHATFEGQVKVQVLRSNRPIEVQVGVRKTGMVKLIFKDSKSGKESEQSPIQVVDVVLAQGRACTLVSRSERFCIVGNNAYEVPARSAVNLKFGVELWRGLFISARVGEGYRPMVNIDVSHAAFYRPQSVLNYICDVLNGDRSPPRYSVDQIQSNTRLSEGELKIVGRAVKGLRVSITHRKCDAQYRIIGIAADASRQMFTLRDGHEVSVADYFKETYFQLRFPRMPALQAGSKNRSIYLPVERVLHDVVVKHSVMTATNLALKINMKMGGVNTRLLADPFVKANLTDKNTLVLGVDVTHPHVADRDSPSIAAVVGNVDVNCAEYAASIRVQPNRRESILYLEDEFRERIRAFVHRSDKRPSRIIMFRDGVSEGEFRQVLREELRALRAACRSMDKAYRPGITYVVVQKRHHARFMCKDESMAVGKGRNIPAGTVIDRRVTSADGYEFYLCSHTGIQGTSKPAKYNVLYDDNNLNSDTMQAIAYYLCHVYGRCMRSVSIPAPVYFAHLACYRSRHHSYLLTGGSSDDSFRSRTRQERNGVEFTRAVTVHDNIRSTMYFI